MCEGPTILDSKWRILKNMCFIFYFLEQKNASNCNIVGFFFCIKLAKFGSFKLATKIWVKINVTTANKWGYLYNDGFRQK